MANLRFDVVTPSLNCVEYIESNLESVRSSLRSIRHHVVFDGDSTDGTWQLLETAALRHSFLRVFCEKDTGAK